ncbi:MAG: S8 family serine peptidase [Alphaproteobacteria bacterium]
MEIPPTTALAIAERVAGGPSASDDIFLIEPHSVVQAEPLLGTPDAAPVDGADRPLPTQAARAAVLDGMPITEHPLLRDRLVVIDPDDAATRVIVANRRHGTAISSLIVHGELPANEPPLNSRVLVRPVLTHVSMPDAKGKVLEQFDADKLTVEIVHEALSQLFGETPDPAANDVFVVNVSLGDRNRPAGAGPVSGWARLLDWWSATAGVLFIVSTGNDPTELALQDFADYNAADDARPEAMNIAAMRALIASRATRPVLSPAEGINVFTIGAAHGEAAPPPTLPSTIKDPITLMGAPSLISRGGPGIANAMKPDVLMPGGRTLGVIRSTASGPALKWTPAEVLSGQQSASAPDGSTQPFPVGRSHGSSNAAALATRLSVRAVDNLMVEGGAFPEGLDRRQSALLAKCLIGHAAAWGPAGRFALDLVAQNPRNPFQERRAVSDLFGYGLVDAERALASSDQRITLLDVGVVRKNQGIVYQFSPPDCLSPSAERRIITGTVAWFTPVQATRRLYRQAELFIDDLFDDGYALGVDPQSAQPMEALACRGTIWMSEVRWRARISHGEDDLISLRVSCRETYPGALSAKMDIYYAVALTIEVGADIALPIYDDVMAAIEAKNIIRARERIQI